MFQTIIVPQTSNFRIKQVLGYFTLKMEAMWSLETTRLLMQ